MTMMRSFLAVALLLGSGNGLSVTPSADSRRSFLQKVSTASVAAATGLTLTPPPSLAVTGMNKVNAVLLGYVLLSVVELFFKLIH